MNHGQFTIMVVLGVIAVAAILGAAWLSLTLTQEQTSEEQEDVISDELASTNAEELITSCLRAASKQAMRDLAQRGGVYWDNGTRGYIDPSQYITGYHLSSDVRIPYVVNHTGAARCPTVSSHNTDPANSVHHSDYPVPTESLPALNLGTMNTYCYGKDSGFFGTRHIIPLCNVSGPNHVPSSSLGGCGSYTPTAANTTSLEYGLKNYTEGALQRCFNPARLQTNVEVLDEPSVTYLFGDTSVTVNASYPVQTEDDTTQGQRTTYQTVFDVPYRDYYRTFNYFVTQEIHRDNYTLNATGASPYLDENTYTMDVTHATPDGDRLLTLRGNAFADEPIQLQGMIQNRRPMINPYVNLDVDKDGCDTTLTTTTSINVTDPDGDNLTIIPTTTSSNDINTDVDRRPDGTYELHANTTLGSTPQTETLTVKGVNETTYDKYDEVNETTPVDIRFKCDPGP